MFHAKQISGEERPQHIVYNGKKINTHDVNNGDKALSFPPLGEI
jgi:hypothetical protein